MSNWVFAFESQVLKSVYGAAVLYRSIYANKINAMTDAKISKRRPSSLLAFVSSNATYENCQKVI